MHSDLSLQNPGKSAPCHDSVKTCHTKYSILMHFECYWEEATFYF